jgi:ATP-dependent exoDNAse (exonuclease V) beta subunit
VVQEALAHGYRREMYVATPVGASTLEGYVDLVYRGPHGLVVVDYKTDAWRDDADLDAKVARYRLQGGAYAVALEQATGIPVAECVFVFLGADDARERPVSDLPEAMAAVRAALAASSADATTPARHPPGR